MSKVIVTGGGAAGMMAAVAAAECGHTVLLLEKNEKLGKKIYITGKGRCNLTNAGDMDNLFANVMTNAKFLYSAFYAYDNRQVVDFFERNGTPTKVERGNRVFPVSDHASDVTAALQRALKRLHVQICLNTEVEEILAVEKKTDAAQEESGVEKAAPKASKKTGKPRWQASVAGVRLKDGKILEADAVILATGGFSYQTTGSTGDGYRFAKELGHTVIPVSPSLVPFDVVEDYAGRLQGLALKNVRVSISHGQKLLYEEFGEMLFTHFGVSGPILLSASAAIDPRLAGERLSMKIDLKPALSMEQLDMRLVRELAGAGNKQFKNAVVHLFPAKLVPVILELSGLDPEKKANEITREERQGFASLIKGFPLTLDGVRGFDEAVITRGGVAVKEVNPSTMESKLVENLYFCGELLDLDAMTGGYNLQIAWSTGHLAGSSVR